MKEALLICIDDVKQHFMDAGLGSYLTEDNVRTAVEKADGDYDQAIVELSNYLYETHGADEVGQIGYYD